MTRRTPRGTSTTGPAGRRHWWNRMHHRATCGQCGESSRLPYCDVCGYELVRRTRDAAPKVPNV
jgi:CDGSH-type Zn-finger protein